MSLLLWHTLIKSYHQLEPLPHPAELSETFKNTNQYCSPYQIFLNSCHQCQIDSNRKQHVMTQ